MKLLPLVIHGGLIIPRHTALFSDALAVSSIAIVAGGTVTITCSSPHGFAVGSSAAISVTDAEAPNAITAASVDGDGNIVVTTAYPHNLSASPDPARFQAYSTYVKVAGFTSALINGVRDLVATPDRTTFVLTPGGTVSSVTLTGAEVLKDRLEFEITGWHKVTAATATTLTFPCPAAVTRNYTVTTPTVVTNIRIFGAVDHEQAVRQLTHDGTLLELDKAYLFILPQRVRGKGNMTMTGPSPGDDYRQEIEDGFTILVFLPSGGSAAHVGAIDKAQGEVFKAVLRTFMGLKVLRGEICSPGRYVSTFDSHAGAVHARSNAIYAHEYVFNAPFVIGNDDALGPLESTIVDDITLGDGTVPASIYPEGSGRFDDLDLTGIYHYGHPSPLDGSYIMDITEDEA